MLILIWLRRAKGMGGGSGITQTLRHLLSLKVFPKADRFANLSIFIV